MKRLMLAGLVAGLALTAPGRDEAASCCDDSATATCKGADPCKACTSCSSCKHCKEGGGTCGTCK
jgi:hypothetical protein